MKLIDKDRLLKAIDKYDKECEDILIEPSAYSIYNIIKDCPAIDPWHYPSRGELPDKDWTKHPDNVSEECFVLTKRGIGTIARWDNDYRTWFENQPRLPITEVIAWQYFEPPKEEA